MSGSGSIPITAVVALLITSCSYYRPVTHAPTIDAFHASGTTNVMVTQRRNDEVVGWHVRQASMDSSGLHGKFYPMATELADKAHHLRKPKDSNQLGRVCMLRLDPGFVTVPSAGQQLTIPPAAILEVVFTEKDKKKSGGRTTALVATGIVFTTVVALFVYAAVAMAGFRMP